MHSQATRIFLASVLRDMRTRFGRSYFSFVISIGWPLVHLAAIFTGYMLGHKLAPIGDDPAIFAATGAAPYIFCLYPARFTAFAIVQNKPLLQFPILSPIILIFARAILEILSAVVVFAIFVLVLYVAGLATLPLNPHFAVAVVGVTIYFGIALGVFGVILCAFNPMVGILIIVFFTLGLYFSSGAMLPSTMFSSATREILWYNPLYQCVGMLRSAYFSVYFFERYSLLYVINCANIFLLAGLVLERLLRGRLISTR